MTNILSVYCAVRSFAVVQNSRARDEVGEGVISAAIAVLIVAGLGALMWVGFRTIWTDAEATTKSKISEIGG
jgi:Flp pilus assembly pilin Flp